VGKKILVVDGDQLIRELPRSLFKGEAYDVVLGSNGEEAILVAKRANPHLIILEARMPKVDGIRTCAAMRADERTRAIPINLATESTGVPKQTMDSWVDDFVMKPFDLADLVARVKALLKVRHLENRVERAMAYTQQIRGTPFADTISRPPGRSASGHTISEVSMSRERRERVRYDVRFSVLIIAPGRIQKGETENLSGTGACIRCRQPLRPKDDLFIEIEFPTGGPAFQIPAQVVWTSEADPDDEAKTPRMGVRFRLEPSDGKTQ